MATQKLNTLISFSYRTGWYYLMSIKFLQKDCFVSLFRNKPLVRFKFLRSWKILTIRAEL